MADAIGIDIVDTGRIKRIYARYGRRFLRRVLGPGEIALFEHRADKVAFLAGRFAAKEAAIKALGRYLTSPPPLNTLQILNDAAGRPQLIVPSELRDRLLRVRCLVSISHEKSSAVGMAVLTEEI